MNNFKSFGFVVNKSLFSVKIGVKGVLYRVDHRIAVSIQSDLMEVSGDPRKLSGILRTRRSR